MAQVVRRRTAYIGTVIAILALTIGFTLAAANLLLTQQNETGGGNATATSGSVAGVAYVATVLNVTPNPARMTFVGGLGSPAAPDTLGAGLNVFCMSSGSSAQGSACTFGDFSEWENYSFSTGFSGAMELTMFVGSGSQGGAVQSLYVKQATPVPVAGNLLLIWDLGHQNQSLRGLTVTLYQCSAIASCP